MGSWQRGFTLIELITVMILLGIISVVLISRLGSFAGADVQGGRDDIIAALSFAQQTAMVRSNITVEVTANSISVAEDGVPINLGANYYPLTMPSGVSLSPSDQEYVFDKLGRTTAGEITISGSGASQGISAVIKIEASGYAYAE